MSASGSARGRKAGHPALPGRCRLETAINLALPAVPRGNLILPLTLKPPKETADVDPFQCLGPDQKPVSYAWTGPSARTQASQSRATPFAGVLSGGPDSGIGLERLRLRDAGTGAA